MRRRRLSTNDPRKWLPRRKLVAALLTAEDRANEAEDWMKVLEEAHQKLAFCYRIQEITPPPGFVPSPAMTTLFPKQTRMSDRQKAALERLLRIEAYYAARAEPSISGLHSPG